MTVFVDVDAVFAELDVVCWCSFAFACYKHYNFKDKIERKEEYYISEQNSHLFDGHAHIFNKATNALLNGE